jgi:hypothetical protein
VSRNNVRGLMVYQPHAALMVSGFKRVETRDWMPAPDSGVPKGWRGTLLIVSGPQNAETDAWAMKHFDNPLIMQASEKFLIPERKNKQSGQGKSLFSDSCILGAVDLVGVGMLKNVLCPDCNAMKTIRQRDLDIPEDRWGLIVDDGESMLRLWAIEDLEYALGIYEPGRYVWQLANPRRLPELIPFDGNRRLFEVPEEILQQIEAQGVTL